MARLALDPESADIPDLKLFTFHLFGKAVWMTFMSFITFRTEELRPIQVRNSHQNSWVLEGGGSGPGSAIYRVVL